MHPSPLLKCRELIEVYRLPGPSNDCFWAQSGHLLPAIKNASRTARWREVQLAARSKEKGRRALRRRPSLATAGSRVRFHCFCIPSSLIGSAERRLRPLHAGMVRSYRGRFPLRNWNGAGHPLVWGAYSCDRTFQHAIAVPMHTGCGVLRAPGFPCAPFFRSDSLRASLGRIRSRECRRVSVP